VLQRNGGPCALDPALVCSDVHRFVGLCEEAKSLPPREAKALPAGARPLRRRPPRRAGVPVAPRSATERAPRSGDVRRDAPAGDQELADLLPAGG